MVKQLEEKQLEFDIVDGELVVMEETEVERELKRRGDTGR